MNKNESNYKKILLHDPVLVTDLSGRGCVREISWGGKTSSGSFGGKNPGRGSVRGAARFDENDHKNTNAGDTNNKIANDVVINSDSDTNIEQNFYQNRIHRPEMDQKNHERIYEGAHHARDDDNGFKEEANPLFRLVNRNNAEEEGNNFDVSDSPESGAEENHGEEIDMDQKNNSDNSFPNVPVTDDDFHLPVTALSSDHLEFVNMRESAKTDFGQSSSSSSGSKKSGSYSENATNTRNFGQKIDPNSSSRVMPQTTAVPASSSTKGGEMFLKKSGKKDEQNLDPKHQHIVDQLLHGGKIRNQDDSTTNMNYYAKKRSSDEMGENARHDTSTNSETDHLQQLIATAVRSEVTKVRSEIVQSVTSSISTQVEKLGFDIAKQFHIQQLELENNKQSYQSVLKIDQKWTKKHLALF